MATSRDDFVIAIRSAFLKKSNKQKFSLLTLIFLSVLIIILSSLDFKIVRQTRNIINEIVYRSAFIVSYPENLFLNSINKTIQYSTFYSNYKKNLIEIEDLKSEKISNKIIKSENEELKALIEDYSLSNDKILAKVIVDHNSPFLKSIIINKGSKNNIKIGTNIYDKNYLVGKVVEVNYKTSRVLLISDLNSNVPVSISPGNIQAIVSGDGKSSGEIKYIRGNNLQNISDKNIVYTSGTGSIYRSGIPVGVVKFSADQNTNIFKVNFYSDFEQLKFVFAEVTVDIDKNIDEKDKTEIGISQQEVSNTTDKFKLDILNEQIEIFKNTNEKLLNKNKDLEVEIYQLKNQLNQLNNKISLQSKIINQNETDKEELKFLKLNLIYNKKCKKTFSNPKGFKFGTEQYRNCVMNKGKL